MFTLNDGAFEAEIYMEAESCVNLPISRDFLRGKLTRTYTHTHYYSHTIECYGLIYIVSIVYHVPLKAHILFQFLMKGTQ